MWSKFPTRLRKLRDRRSMSRSVLSDRCGVSRNVISRYESGSRKPAVEVLEKLADIFDTSTDYLLGRTDYPGKYPEKIM